MTDQRVWGIARRAAELLPEPPAAHDAFGYLAWQELVLSTAQRLQWLLDRDGIRTPCRDEPTTLTLTPRSDRLDADALLALTGLLANDDTAAGEVALARAVANCREPGSVPGTHQAPLPHRRSATAGRRRRAHSLGTAVLPRG